MTDRKRKVYWESASNAELTGGEGWSPGLWVMMEGTSKWSGGPMADMYFSTREECDEFIEKYLVGASHVTMLGSIWPDGSDSKEGTIHLLPRKS